MDKNVEDIILNIEFSYEKAIKGITDLQEKNEKYKKDLEGLSEQVKKNSISQDEYNKSAAATKEVTPRSRAILSRGKIV